MTAAIDYSSLRPGDHIIVTVDHAHRGAVIGVGDIETDCRRYEGTYVSLELDSARAPASLGLIALDHEGWVANLWCRAITRVTVWPTPEESLRPLDAAPTGQL